MYKDWLKQAQDEFANEQFDESSYSPEGIPIQKLYSSKDLVSRSYIENFPGQENYSRGIRASMYTKKPWTIRQYAGFSTAEESNAFYKQCLQKGQKGLSVAFDLPTHRGYDSDHPRVQGDVGKAGVAIDSILDMELLFSQIPLDRISVSMTMNGAVLPILASYFVAAQRQGVAQNKLRGTIQNDILKEYMVRNTYIYPPQPSMRIVSDIIEHTSKYNPLFNSISISGYHMQEAGANAALELAYTIANGRAYIKAALDRGLDIDDFAPRLSFFFGIGMNFFMEIAKLRAARMLWCEVVKEFGAKNPKSFMLRTHCQTSGYSLTSKEPYNNIVRTTIEAMAATLGGTQSLHTNALDEALGLPTEFSATIARNTQLILQEETDLTKTVDPFGGSYFMESLTLDLCKEAQKILSEIDKSGGMIQAIEKGIPKLRIEESAAQKQAKIDSAKETIVGVNKYISSEEEEVDIRFIDNTKVKNAQLKRLKDLKENRDSKKVKLSLEKLKKAAKKPHENLLASSMEAIANYATIGEVSSALEEVFGRYEGNIYSINTVYASMMEDDKLFKKAQKELLSFQKLEGRKPRILIAKVGQDGHDRGAKIVATGLSDIGFDVDLGPLFQTPKEVAKQAVENDVHIVGISSQAAGHNILVPNLIAEMKLLDASDILIALGGIIPEQDHEKLYKQGVSAIFTPGTPITECAIRLLEELKKVKNK